MNRHTPLTTLLERRAAAAADFAEHAHRPDDLAAHIFRQGVEDADAELRARWPHVDIDFRTALAFGGGYDAPLQQRALTATARTQLGNPDSYTEALLAKTVQAAPLLSWATVLETADGRNLDYGFISTDATANGVVADGATITASDPGFDRAALKSYAYKDVTIAAAELVSDARLNLERLAAEHVAPLIARKLSADLWTGGGTTEPEGLLAGLGTVTASAAGAVDLGDIVSLLAAVPAADRFGGDCVIFLAPGAYDDLLTDQAALGQHMFPLTMGMSLDDVRSQLFDGLLFGVPFVVDPALDDPATTKKSVVAGNIRQAYAIRLAPLRVDVDRTSVASDTVRLRTVLRADGRRMRTAAAKALVHP